MSKTKKAESISVGKCPNCDSVHVFLWRNGEPFAEAIMTPINARAFAADVVDTAKDGKGAGHHVH